MHDCIHLPFLGIDYSPSSDYGDVSDTVVVDALYVYLAFCLDNDLYVYSGNAAIGPMVSSAPGLDMCVAERLYVMEVMLTSQKVIPFTTTSCGLAALSLPFAAWESKCLTFPGGRGFLLVRWARRGCSSLLASGGEVELSNCTCLSSESV